MGLFGKKKEANKADQDVLMGNLEIEDDTSYDIGGTVDSEIDLGDVGLDEDPEETDTSEVSDDDFGIPDIAGLNLGEEESQSTFEIPDIAGDEEDVVETPEEETMSTKNMMYSDDDRQNEVMDFLSNFSDGDQGEVMLNASDLENIQEDIVLAGGEQKSYKGIIVASIIGFVGVIIAFIIAFIASQYNLVMDPVLNAAYVYDGKISLVEKNPIVQSQDLADGIEILYKEDPTSRFADKYNKGIVKKIKERTVRVYNEETAKEEDIPYEQIWYIVDKYANGEVEIELNDKTQQTSEPAKEETYHKTDSAAPSEGN